MPQWSDKVIEPGSDEVVRKAREADLFAEVRKRMGKAWSWARKIMDSGTYGPDTQTLLALKVYDELKALDEQMKKDFATPRTPQASAGEGTQTLDPPNPPCPWTGDHR